MTVGFVDILPDDFYHNSIRLSAAIESKLESDHDVERNVLKILLLGAGDTGKSTFLRQMKILYSGGFSAIENDVYRLAIRHNLIQAVQQVVLETEFHDEALRPDTYQMLFFEALCGTDLSRKVKSDLVRTVCSDQDFHATLKIIDPNLLSDSAQFLLRPENIDRILAEDFTPTQHDALIVRIPTLGISAHRFKMDQAVMNIFDVGGQRGQRRKWIEFFADVTSVIFFASLSEYDQVAVEDPSRNRMQDSLQLFTFVCSQKIFKETAIILFLNKADLFKEKSKRVDLGLFFPEYKAGCNFNAALEFIQCLFDRCRSDQTDGANNQVIEAHNPRASPLGLLSHHHRHRHGEYSTRVEGYQVNCDQQLYKAMRDALNYISHI